MTSDEIMSPEQQEREKNVDPRVIELIDRDLKEGVSTAEAHARQQIENPYWPIGLCVAWMLGRGQSEAVRLYARHRLGMEVRQVEGWADARTKLLYALAGGQIEAWGVRPKDGPRVMIAPQEWIDLRIQQRGSYDEVRRADGSIAYREVKIAATMMHKEWPAETPATTGARQKQEQESACLKAVMELMRAEPNEPIAKETLRAKFVGVSERAFDKLYTLAVRETGAAAWSKGGRRHRNLT